jgi:hypothetical protein
MVGIRWSPTRHCFVVELTLSAFEARDIVANDKMPANMISDLMAATELVELRNAALPKASAAL